MHNNKFSFIEILIIFIIFIILTLVTINLYSDYQLEKKTTNCIKLIDTKSNNYKNKLNECLKNN